MREIISWLREVEHLAGEVYQQAAAIHADDPVFARFLARLAEEEAWHYHVMGSAANLVASDSDRIPAIAIDHDTGQKIINYFITMKTGLEDGSLSQVALLEKIVEAELSEWNDIFFYVVNSLKETSSEFKYPAARIQSHIKTIEQYVENVRHVPEILRKIRKLPPVWVEKILIVEDNAMIAGLLKSLLNREGDIDIAGNGEEGLTKIERKYYKLVISDIDMPVMDGLDLYRKAIARFPNLRSRFILMSGDMTADRLEFMARHKIAFLTKPMRIKEMRDLAMSILLSN